MVVAYGRLLVQASRRGAESFKGLGLNNLFLCVLFLSAGSHGPRTAFWSALPFLLVVVTPMLAASSVDALTRCLRYAPR